LNPHGVAALYICAKFKNMGTNYFSKKTGILFISLLLASIIRAQGPGNCVDFTANSANNNYINVGNLSSINNSNFSVEMWIYVGAITAAGGYEDPSFFSNKDWDSGNNTGIVLFADGASTGNFRCNFKGASGARVDHNTNIALMNGWNHIAVTFNRTDSLKCYVNGVFAGGKSISASTGSIGSANTYKIGQDGIGDYAVKFNGKIDEFRIWNTVRSLTEIRTNLCKKLVGTEPGLITYYRIDEGTGTNINDLSSANNDGTLTNPAAGNWVVSEAALGDASSFLYTNSWAGQNISSLSASNGDLLVNNITGSPAGVHVYRVDAVPSNTTGILGIGSNQTYYGIYTVNGTSPSYTINYDYSDFPSAVANEANLILFERTNNASAAWSNASAVVSTPTNTITDNNTNRKEIILGGTTASICNDPSTPTATVINSNNATISWTTGGAGNWNIEYGISGFTPGTGTQVLNTTNNPYTINGLNPNTAYHVYVQDTCGSFGSSNWVGPLSFTTLNNPGLIGPGTSLEFGGTKYISIGTSSALRPTNAITVEAWMKCYSQSDWMSFLSNAQDNASNESGYSMSYYGGKWRFFLMTENMAGNEWNGNPGADLPLNEWVHVAGTYDGSVIKFYVNGMLIETKNATGNIDWTYAPLDFRLGMFVDDNETYYYDGQIDEIKVWNIARTQTQIRDFMCKKQTGSESGLIAYYRMDDAVGNVLSDLSTSNLDGNLTNMSNADWLISGAALGDASTHQYTNSWTGTSVNLTSTSFGNLSVDSVLGVPDAIQVYRVDQAPYYLNGVYDPGGTQAYYGVFVVNGTTPTYRTQYNYSNYANAVANENYLSLYNKSDASVYTWANYGAILVAIQDKMVANNVLGRKEFFLADFMANPCPTPSGLGATNIGFSTADANWTSGGGTIFNVQWGPVGFTPGTGTAINGISGTTTTITGMSDNTTYQYYVQNDCGGSPGAWVGPFTFTTNTPCPDPTSITAGSITSNSAQISWTNGLPNWEMQWGLTGFTFGTGINSNLTTNPYTMGGLLANTTYDIYIRDNCDSLYSNWVGPITFTTLPAGTGFEELSDGEILIYPNPTVDYLSIKTSFELKDATIKITSIDGKEQISVTNMENHLITIPVHSLIAGTYFIEMVIADKYYYTRFIKQ
jgi:hypothetical protein